MKKLALPLLAGLLVVSGCASHYVIKLANGTEITSANKPQREGGAYRFKDSKGEEHLIAVGRVREIAPASMANEDERSIENFRAPRVAAVAVEDSGRVPMAPQPGAGAQHKRGEEEDKQQAMAKLQSDAARLATDIVRTVLRPMASPSQVGGQ